jgi:hypothetical protein
MKLPPTDSMQDRVDSQASVRTTSFFHRLRNLPAPAKWGIVLGGYTLAILIPAGIVWLHVLLTSGPQYDASSGMYAFGDALLFIALFGMIAIIPTGAAAVFLGLRRTIIALFLLATLAVAAVGVVAFVV